MSTGLPSLLALTVLSLRWRSSGYGSVQFLDEDVLCRTYAYLKQAFSERKAPRRTCIALHALLVNPMSGTASPQASTVLANSTDRSSVLIQSPVYYG